jgi:hypothetical protein
MTIDECIDLAWNALDPTHRVERPSAEQAASILAEKIRDLPYEWKTGKTALEALNATNGRRSRA